MPIERTSFTRTYRVVVAEDNTVLRDLLMQQLQERGHAIVGAASTGIEVVEVVARARPDVVVIDRGLPLQDGLEASRAIAAQTPTAVVLLSGYLPLADPEEEARAAGAQVFLAKPYTMEELEASLHLAMERFTKAGPSPC